MPWQKIPVAVEILDIDYFKQYNDNYGHQKGDLCICRVAKEIQKLAEKDGIFCARYGGDEFILIYEDIPGSRSHSYRKIKTQHP